MGCAERYLSIVSISNSIGDNDMNVTVLITAVGSSNAVSIIKALHKQNEQTIRIIGTDTNHANEIAGSSFCDRFYQVPVTTDPAYIDILLRICREEGVQVLFPIVDAEVEAIAAVNNLFKEYGVIAWVSDVEVVQTCNDKLATFAFFSKHHLAMPSTWSGSDALVQAETLPYPIVIKPRSGRGSIGIECADNPHTLHRILSANHQHSIVQTYLAGREFTIDVLVDMEGRARAAVPRERLEVKAGVAFKAITVDHKAIINDSVKVAETLGIRGVCNVQCRLVNDIPQFFEVNPRFPSALPITVAAGVNMPHLLVKLALKEPLEHAFFPFQAGVYMARYWEEIFYQHPI
jgi:carbamoyl-phosphate synthase large subunit